MLTRQELRQLQAKELSEEILKSSRELIKTRMEHASGTLKETHKLPDLKRYIARMKTVAEENKRAPASASPKK